MDKMSIKKELLNELTEEQLKQLAKFKEIELALSIAQENYYKGWDEKDKLVDMMNDNRQISVSDIEKFIIDGKS